MIDFLRQTRRAMHGHTALLDKLDRCVTKINRGVVDAERQLRIGQEGDPSHDVPIPIETANANGEATNIGTQASPRCGSPSRF